MPQEPYKSQSNSSSDPFLHPACIPRVRIDFRRPLPESFLELIRARLPGLPEPDAALVGLVLLDGRSFRQAAALTRQSHRTLRRRLHVIVDRLLHPAFPIVMTRQATWEGELREVAVRHFLRGEHLTHIAADLKLTRYQARLCRELVLAIVATQQHAANPKDRCA